MKPAKTFEDLIVWQKAHKLTLEVYQVTKTFPREEVYGLSSQMRRAAVSVPSNIAEGFHRIGAKEKQRFYNIAQASLQELRYQLILTRDLNYSNVETLLTLATEVGKLLNKYASKMDSNS